MIIYYEIVYIENFFIDLFIFSLTVVLLNQETRASRLIASSAIGGGISVIAIFFYRYIILIKIVGMFFLPFLYSKCKNFKNYLVSLSTFISITLLLGGMAYALKCSCPVYLYKEVTYGGIPILFSISGLCVILLINELKREGKRMQKKYPFKRNVEISDGIKTYKGEAFYDSGNRVYAKNGEPVTVVGEKVYNRFVGQEEELEVATVTGRKILKVKDAEIKIYSEDNNNKIYQTKIACASFMGAETEILLHSDMGG